MKTSCHLQQGPINQLQPRKHFNVQHDGMRTTSPAALILHELLSVIAAMTVFQRVSWSGMRAVLLHVLATPAMDFRLYSIEFVNRHELTLGARQAQSKPRTLSLVQDRE